MNGKQLKNSILQWAIQGKLVPQDPNDEPASVLLERIRLEKERLIKEKKIKRDKNESIIYRGADNSHYEKILATGEVRCIDDEIPFEIPNIWAWCRIRDISQSYIGLTYAPTDVSTQGTIVLRSSNIKDGKLDLNDIVRVNKPINEKLQVNVNDIIICARNGSKKLVGKSAIVRKMNEPMTFGAFMAICKTQLYNYIYLFLQSDLFFSQLRKVSDTTTINQLTQNNFNGFLVPIPPYSEQERIIAQYEELLPIVEKYSTIQEELDKLNATISNTLKKSILQEAIQGKLVPQNPTDEPANKLLERIRNEKQALVKQGKLKAKDITDSTIFRGADNKYYEKIGDECVEISEEIPFELPQNWCWCRIGQIAEFINGLAFKPNEWEQTGLPIIRIQNLSDSTKQFNYTTKVFDEKFKVSDGDLLFSWSATLDAFIWDGKDSWLNQHIFKVNPHSCVDKFFLYYALKGLVVNLKHITHGLTMKHLTRGVFENYLFALPPLNEQKRIVERITELYCNL